MGRDVPGSVVGSDHTGMAQSVEGPFKGIKALVDAGIQYVPQSYIRPPQERPSFPQVCHLKTIPVIDFAGLVGDSRKDVLKEIERACHDWGFFQVINHGVPEPVIDRMWEGADLFFKQPADERMKFYSQDRQAQVSFKTSFNLSTEKVREWMDSIIFRYIPTKFNGFECGPDYCRESVLEYLQVMGSFGTRLNEILCESLGLDLSEVPEVATENSTISIRINCYPPCPDPRLTFGVSGHSDPNYITVLLQDGVGGLEIRKEDQWVPIQPLPGAFVVNLGDIIQILTNGKYKSVEHRVVTNSQKQRMSIVCFFAPPWETKLAPLQDFIDQNNPPLYEETCYGDFLSNFTSQQGLDGKSHLDFCRQPQLKNAHA